MFSVNASGHPFWIQTVSGAYSSGNIYSTGITNGGDDVGTITFSVPYNAPSTLYYVCQFHSGMAGTINISDVGPQGVAGPQGPQGPGANQQLNTTSSVIFGSLSVTGSLGFYGVELAVQPVTTGTTIGATTGTGDLVTVDTTFTGNTGTSSYTIGDIVNALKKIGLLGN